MGDDVEPRRLPTVRVDDRARARARTPKTAPEVESELGLLPTLRDRSSALARARPEIDAEGDLGHALMKADVRGKLFGPPASNGAPPAERARIGRFTVLRTLGEGGMGVVYAARDEELERVVAIKLLRDDGGDSEGERRRLLREAKALARLSHPAVVTVHDVGVHEGHTFLAMELVDGETLDAWLRAGPGEGRSWREVVSVYLGAGEGLAAAHAEGVVHRDFKPANVMVRGDGRVVVLDFGLARGPRAQRADAGHHGYVAPQASSGARAALGLTETGTIAGTPAYMSPEQFEGRRVTAASDQFSFCVALYEGLHGRRPFAGQTVAELARNVTEGTRTSAPPRALPRELVAALDRGLSAAPEDRFASINELLAALRAIVAAPQEASRAHSPWIVAVAIAVVAAGGAIAARGLLGSRSAGQPVLERGPASGAGSSGAALSAEPGPDPEPQPESTLLVRDLGSPEHIAAEDCAHLLAPLVADPVSLSRAGSGLRLTAPERAGAPLDRQLSQLREGLEFVDVQKDTWNEPAHARLAGPHDEPLVLVRVGALAFAPFRAKLDIRAELSGREDAPHMLLLGSRSPTAPLLAAIEEAQYTSWCFKNRKMKGRVRCWASRARCEREMREWYGKGRWRCDGAR